MPTPCFCIRLRRRSWQTLFSAIYFHLKPMNLLASIIWSIKRRDGWRWMGTACNNIYQGWIAVGCLDLPETVYSTLVLNSSGCSKMFAVVLCEPSQLRDHHRQRQKPCQLHAALPEGSCSYLHCCILIHTAFSDPF